MIVLYFRFTFCWPSNGNIENGNATGEGTRLKVSRSLVPFEVTVVVFKREDQPASSFCAGVDRGIERQNTGISVVISGRARRDDLRHGLSFGPSDVGRPVVLNPVEEMHP